jgi:hypothetical protein
LQSIVSKLVDYLADLATKSDLETTFKQAGHRRKVRKEMIAHTSTICSFSKRLIESGLINLHKKFEESCERYLEMYRDMSNFEGTMYSAFISLREEFSTLLPTSYGEEGRKKRRRRALSQLSSNFLCKLIKINSISRLENQHIVLVCAIISFRTFRLCPACLKVVSKSLFVARYFEQ